MPDQPQPDHPQFGFFLDADPGDEANLDEANPVRPGSLVYPTRQDYELDELERVSAQLDAARQALAEVYDNVPVFMQARLERLRVILGGE